MPITQARRNELQTRGGEIYRTALQEKRKLTDQEQAELRNLEHELDREEYERTFGDPNPPSDAQRRFTASVETRSNNERPLILTPEMRMRDAVRGTYPAEHENLSLGRFVRGFVTGNWENADAERRAMAEGTIGAGGATVPTPLSANVIDAIRNQSVAFRAGAVSVPMTSAKLLMARLKTDPTAAWTAENTTITASDGEFEQVTFTAQKLAALVKCSVELIEDSANASSVIENALAQVMALEVDRVALFGSGIAPEPKGLHTYANTVVPEVLVGADGATITSFDKLSDGYFTAIGNNVMPVAAIYGSRTAKQLDQFKEATTNAPLPAPASWAGLRKLVSNQVPANLVVGASGATTSPVLIGDFSGLAIGTRTNLVLEVSRTASDAASSAFASGQVFIRCYLRGDVQLLKPKAFCMVRGLKA